MAHTLLLSLVGFAASFALAQPSIQFTPVAGGLDRPTQIVSPHDGSGRLFVTEQPGLVRIVTAEGELKNFVDLRPKIGEIEPGCCAERGLLGFAFPPGSGPKTRFYVFYINPDSDVVVSRFHVKSDNPDAGDPDSEEVLYKVEHPGQNHYGGTLQFNPVDGYLYFSIGDGAGGGNPLRSAQDPEQPYGKIHRIDAERSNNPAEIYAQGLRNPWRFSFHPEDGGLFIADVGEESYEELNYLPGGTPPGTDFGWSTFEGTHCFEDPDCSGDGMTPPIFVYSHDLGCSIVGGEVYRGTRIPELYGKYLMGDLCSGRIWSTAHDADRGWVTEELAQSDKLISTFGIDEHGEIYLGDVITGEIYRIDPAGDAAAQAGRVTRRVGRR